MPSLLAPEILHGKTILPKTVAFIIDDDVSPDARVSEIKTLLENNGWTVDYINDENLTAPGDLDGYGVMLISHSVVEGNVVDKDAGLDLDIGIVWIGTRLDPDHEIDTLSVTSGGETEIYVVDVTHPITSFLGSAGLYRVYQSGTVLNELSSIGADANLLARRDTSGGNPVFWTYEKGDNRPGAGGGTFAGRRVITWIQGQGGQRLDCSACSYRGETLLLNCLDWVTYRK